MTTHHANGEGTADDREHRPGRRTKREARIVASNLVHFLIFEGRRPVGDAEMDGVCQAVGVAPSITETMMGWKPAWIEYDEETAEYRITRHGYNELFDGHGGDGGWAAGQADRLAGNEAAPAERTTAVMNSRSGHRCQPPRTDAGHLPRVARTVLRVYAKIAQRDGSFRYGLRGSKIAARADYSLATRPAQRYLVSHGLLEKTQIGGGRASTRWKIVLDKLGIRHQPSRRDTPAVSS